MDFLINLDSPAAKNIVKYNSRKPLIPSTRIPTNIQSPNNNPFDAVINVAGRNQQPQDPFDIVLQASLQGNNSFHQDSSQIAKHNETRHKDYKNMKEEKKSLSSSLTEETSLNFFKLSNVKEFVSKRITSCIERTINASLSQIDLTKTSKDSRTQFRRSFSAGMLRTNTTNSVNSPKYFEDLNSSAPLGVTQTLSKETNSNGTFTCETSSLDLNIQSDNTFNFEDMKLNLRSEANKLSNIITKVKYSSQGCEKTVNSSTDDYSSEDLFDVRPPWECEDILTDEEQDSVGLPKVKTYRDSISGFNATFENETLRKYIKRRNIDWEHSEETTRIQDISKETVEAFSPDASSSLAEDLPKNEIPTIQIESNLMNEISNKNQIRFKKKTGIEIPKKGPLKAFVPIQKMSKNITSKVSQLKSKSPQVVTNNKDETFGDSDIRPVAASTPTKSKSATGISPTASTNSRRRVNNVVSPPGRKPKRSSSLEVLGRNKGGKNSSIPKVPAQKVTKTDGQEGNAAICRPQSAPDKSNLDKPAGNFSRAALKALGSRPINRAGKMKMPVVSSAQDKENQDIYKK